MKKNYSFLAPVLLLFFAENSLAATITSDGLNNSSSLFTLSNGAYYTGNSASGDRPASSPFASEGSHSRGVSSATATLTSSDISTSGYTGIQLTFRLASFSIGSTGNGADGIDIVTVEISPDGGTNYYSTVRVLGNSNAYWGYSTGTGNATTAYDGNATPVDYAPTGGGSRTTDGYSTVTVTDLPATSNMRIRITLLNNSANERWVMDDVLVTGNSSTNLYWGGTTGTYSGTWTTGTPWGTTTSSGATTAWPGSGSYNANFNAAASGIATVPTSISVAPNNVILNAAATFNTAAATNGTLSGPVNLNSNTLTTAPVTSTTLTLSGVISGAGGITQDGAGTTTLSVANTYTGTTTISQGTLSASTIVVSGSASNLGNASSAVVLGGASTAGTLSYAGAAATYTRGFTVNAGGGGITNTTANLLTIGTGGITNGGTLTLANTGSGGTTVSSVISSTGGVLVNNSGSGITILSGSNSYSGTTAINGGTLQLGVNSTLPSATAVTIANTSGVILDVNGKTQTIASLAGGGGTGGTVSLGAGTLTVNGSTSTTYSGIISGSGGALAKNGTSTLTLAGANTYTGATTISAGTLQLGAAGSGANSPLGTTGAGTTVSAGAVLDLNGYTLATAEGLTLNGTGISSGGALVNSSGTAVSYSGNIALGNASSIGTTGNITLSGNISGPNILTKVGNGSLILSGANTYNSTIITAGELRFNPSATLSSGALSFNGTGATLSTSGITSGRAITFSQINFFENAAINLDNTNAHTLTFSAGIAFSSGKMLTITGWQGTYGVSNTGSIAKIYIGSSATSLNCTMLGQIQFFDGTTYYAASLKSDGELVPVKTPAISAITPSSATAGDPGFTITVDGSNFTNGVSTVTWGGSARATTFVSDIQLTASILTADLVTAGTVQVGVTNGCVTTPSTQTFTINAPSNSITTSAGSFGPFCNGVDNNVTLTFSKTGTFTGQYNIQISDASGNFPSDATTQLLTYVSNTSTTVTATIPSGFTAGTGYRIRVVNNTPTYFSSGDNGSDIAVNTTPTTPSCSTPGAVCQGNAVTITGAGSTGATTYTYWTAASGGTQFTTGSPAGYTVSGGNLTTPGSLAGGTYDFYVQAENAALCSSLARQKVTVTVNSLPADPTGSITVSPSNPSCGPATLSYTTGYYWETSTSDFTTSGRGTATDYTLNTTGTMYVRAYNGTCWSANTINTGTVTINTAVGIGTSPNNATVTEPATATFSISSVTGTVSGYQWQVSTDGGSTWNNVSTGSGGTSASYTTAATSAGMSGNKYQCIVFGTSPCADDTSGIATLTVNVAASVIAEFDFTASPYLQVTTKDANVTVTDMALSAGTIETNITTGTYFPNEPYVEESGGWTATSQATAKNFNFTINANSGYQIQVTSMEFNAYATSAGPSAFSYDIGSGLATYTTNAPDGSLVTVNQTVSGVTAQTTLPVLIQGWLNGSRSSAGTGVFRLDDVIVKGYVTPTCTLPTSQATSVTTTNISSTGSDAGFTRGSATGTILVIKPTAQTTVLPVQNTAYTPNVNWASAAQINTDNRVVANSTAATTSTVSVTGITGLSPETQYTLTAYERSSTNCYNLTSPPTLNFYTLSTEPSIQPTGSFTAATCTANSIDLTFPSITGAGVSNADGYIVMMNAGSAPTNSPADGQAYSVNANISGDTVAAVISSTATSSITISGLNAGVQYYFTLIPYNANSTPTAQTFNYKTNGSILGANTTTLLTGTSTASVVTTDATYSYTQDILYANYQSNPVPTSASQSVGVHNIIIQDGNGSSNDGDNLPTLLKGITFTYTGTANTVRSAALFTTTNSRIRPATSIGSNTITFTNLPDTVTLKTPGDNSSIQVILRVTFNSTVTDNDKLVFTVSSVTSGDLCSYSQFGTANGGGAQSDNGANTKNQIEVVATKLKFSQQPSDAANGSTMSPTVTLDAADNNNNVDKDWSVAASVACSTPSALNSNPVGGTILQGVTTIGALVHNTNGTYTLTASAAGLRDTTSTTYIIATVLYPYGSFLSKTGSGNYNSNSSWCKCGNTGGCSGLTVNSGGWGDPTTNTQTPVAGSTVFVQGTITYSSLSIGVTNATILSGGDLVLNSSNFPVANSITVKSGGKLHVNDNCVFELTYSTSTFTVEDNAEVHLNRDYTNPSSSVWQGAENFYPQSNIYIYNWREATYLIDGDVTANTHNGYNAYFGNLYIDGKLTVGSVSNSVMADYNDYGFGGGNWDMVGPNNGDTINLTHGNLELVSSPENTSGSCSCGSGTPGYKSVRIMGNETGTFVVNIHGNLVLRNTWEGSAVSSTDGNYTLNVDGNVDINGGSLSVKNSTSTNNGINTMNIAGNLTMTGTTSLFLNPSSLNAANGQKAVLNLKGNLTVASTSTVQNNVFPTDAEFNFTGTGPQLVDVASVVAPSGKGITFTIKNGATVQLKNNNFTYTTALSGYPTTLTVASGGTLDFNWKTDGTPLTVNGASTINLFTLASGGTLKISSPDGIIKNTATYGSSTGNVTGFATGNRDFNQVARYWYTGKSTSNGGTHYTGDGINQTGASNGFGKIVICDLSDNNKILTPTVTFALTNDSTTFPGGGRLDIRKGQFIETENEYISGTDGTLYMSPGTFYKIPRGNSSFVTNDDIPRMCGCGTGSFPYVLTGGTIELAGTGSNHAFQRLRADAAAFNYINIKFSGSNTLGTNYKNLNDQTTIDSLLYITGNAIVDCVSDNVGIATSFIGRGGLKMDGGRLRIKKFNEANPMLDGYNNPYTLTGGVVEFYGTGSTSQQQIRGMDTLDRIISYYNIEVNANAANYSTSSGLDKAGNVDLTSSFYLKNVMNVNYPAVLRMDESDFIYAPLSGAGAEIVNINANAGLLYGNSNGITTAAAGTGVTVGNIRTSNRTFSSDASYGFVSPGNMVSGNGLPATVKGLYVYKSNTSDKVTLTNTTRADSILKMYSGHILTGASNILELGKGINTGETGSLSYTAGYIAGKMRRWFNGSNTGNASGLFPIGDTSGTNFYNRLFLMEFSTLTGTDAGYLDINFNRSPMGLAGIPITGIPAAGTCANPFDVTSTEDQGYWVATPESSKLSAGTYTASATGEGFSSINNMCQLTLLKRVGGGNWTTPGTHLQPTGTMALPTVSRSGISGFSNFGFGGGPPNPLPIELTSFTGTCLEDGTAQLQWTTASENNSKQFIIQRSADGVHFDNIAVMRAAGFSNQPRSYSITDSSVISSVNYYRLLELDNEGNSTIYSIILVKCREVNGVHVFYNDPKIVLEVNSDKDKSVAVHVFELSGKLLHLETKSVTRGYNRFNLDIKNKLADGLYIIQLTDGLNIFSDKVLVH
ncbi:MAG: autotransporter-associated beta strand repeat-containing protein [Sphingobacteriales bacterium]|nr:autotransporter-associated beta strand repeat-containing protein [Sphingobacteriales bacterium]